MGCKVEVALKSGGVISVDHSEVGNYFKGLSIETDDSENRILLHEGTSFAGCKFHTRKNAVIDIRTSRYGIHGLVIHSNGGTIKIGENFSCWGVNISCQERGSYVEIGNDNMYSRDILIYATDIHAIHDINTKEVINHCKPIIIGDHVWIGRRVDILKGVKLAENIVVGMGSVVTKSFLHGNVAIAGNPASIIKTNINWTRKHVDEF